MIESEHYSPDIAFILAVLDPMAYATMVYCLYHSQFSVESMVANSKAKRRALDVCTESN